MTHNELMNEISKYVEEATNDRNDGWVKLSYLLKINDIKELIDRVVGNSDESCDSY